MLCLCMLSNQFKCEFPRQWMHWLFPKHLHISGCLNFLPDHFHTSGNPAPFLIGIHAVQEVTEEQAKVTQMHLFFKIDPQHRCVVVYLCLPRCGGR